MTLGPEIPQCCGENQREHFSEFNENITLSLD
jgi:hypothetical protein